MSKRESSPARGMRDILPAEAELRDRVADTILSTYRSFGFQHIETPAMERIEMLSDSGGGENEKLIFKVLKRGEKLDLTKTGLGEDDLVDYGLRYDLTVPLARFYAQNRAQLPRPFKAIQIGPVWRAERPQRGRFRQFTQCDIDTIGSDAPMIETDLLAATSQALVAIGFEGLQIRINDRRLLSRLALASGFAEDDLDSVFITLDKMDKVGIEGVRKELTEKGQPIAAIDAIEALVGALPDDLTDIDAVAAALEANGIGANGMEPAGLSDLRVIADGLAEAGDGNFTVALDPLLVRGMGYYTGPIFEVQYGDYPFSIAGGGRYDRMVGSITGEDTPAAGISIGFERVVTILQEEAAAGTDAGGKRLALLVAAEAPLSTAFREARRRREEGYVCSVIPQQKKIGKQIKALSGEGFTHLIVFRPENDDQNVEPLSG